MSKKLLYIDFEQVFDVWSLLFCISRGIFPMKNKDYDLIVNKSIEQSVETICQKFQSDKKFEIIG